MGCEMISEKVKVHVFHVQNDEYQVKCKRNTQVQNYSELLDFFFRECACIEYLWFPYPYYIQRCIQTRGSMGPKSLT